MESSKKQVLKMVSQNDSLMDDDFFKGENAAATAGATKKWEFIL